jgi:hypothetical protein
VAVTVITAVCTTVAVDIATGSDDGVAEEEGASATEEDDETWIKLENGVPEGALADEMEAADEYEYGVAAAGAGVAPPRKGVGTMV